MRPFLDPHINSKPWWQRLFQADAHPESNHRCQRAMTDCGREIDYYGGDAGARRGRWDDVYVWQVDYCEGAEGEGMLGIGDVLDQV